MPLTINDVITEQKMFAVAKDGRKFWVRVALGRPFQQGEEAWACPMVIEGLHDKLPPCVNVTSWQAVHLAQLFCHTMLLHFVSEGGALYYNENCKDGNKVVIEPFDSFDFRRNHTAISV